MSYDVKKSLYQELVMDFLSTIGITQKLKGYYFTVYGITEILCDYKQSAEIIKNIARNYEVKSRIVHDNIRYMIHISWNVMDCNMKMMFEGTPSPKAFLIEMAEIIRKNNKYKEIVFSS